MFGNQHLSALWRLVESRCQNNEAPVESVIGIFANQTFRNQSEVTGENRAIIKVNGDDNIIGLKETGELVAQFSADGIPEWDIKRLNLPITYGRYKINTLAKVVVNQTSKIANKQNYMYNCSGETFYNSNLILHYGSLHWNWLMKRKRKMMTKISLKIQYKNLRSNLILSIKHFSM